LIVRASTDPLSPAGIDDWEIEENHSNIDSLTIVGQLALIVVAAKKGIDQEKIRRKMEKFERLESVLIQR
jgi:hypothetical protein